MLEGRATREKREHGTFLDLKCDHCCRYKIRGDPGVVLMGLKMGGEKLCHRVFV